MWFFVLTMHFLPNIKQYYIKHVSLLVSWKFWKTLPVFHVLIVLWNFFLERGVIGKCEQSHCRVGTAWPPISEMFDKSLNFNHKDLSFARVSGGKPAFLACRCCKFRNGANLSIYSDRPLVFLNIWTHTQLMTTVLVFVVSTGLKSHVCSVKTCKLKSLRQLQDFHPVFTIDCSTLLAPHALCFGCRMPCPRFCSLLYVLSRMLLRTSD